MKTSRNIISSLLVAAVSLVAVVGAQAQTSSNNDNNYSTRNSNNRYLDLNVGTSDFNQNNGSGVYPSDSRYTTYGVHLGAYSDNSNLGLEVGYTDFGRLNRAGGTTRADGFSLSLVGRIPFGTAFNLMGKVGALYSRTDVSVAPGSGITPGSEAGFDWTYGVGAEYAVNSKWSAVLQYDENYLKFAGGSHDRVKVTALGVRYRY